MSPEKLFSVCNALALGSWIVLIFFNFYRTRNAFVVTAAVVFFCFVYAWLIFSNFSSVIFHDFQTLEGVSNLFSNKVLLLAGWIHYLAFDLITGIYIVKDAAEKGIKPWIVLPSLFCTFMLGPVGLLIYFLIRTIKTKAIF